ncbi:hypothetical protein [Schleiferia thermophila]|uniref:Uncharacterized protein n=1 Tax=Schleiferia thermophila TaxID=884107 RepID=A0A369A6U2_9FLAO|nr:hypothetical protein [Schleiferia thermophila]RCX04861.1 hypothetical protein DES35_101131 [Schleiferia thermophila]GCD79613.1 hypothetical protein JCM30197_08600 [Schleiferia thermophila]
MNNNTTFIIKRRLYGLLLPLVLFISCKNHKSLTFTLTEFEFELIDSLTILERCKNNLSYFHSRMESDTLYIYASDQIEKEIYSIKLHKNRLIDVNKSELKFLKNDPYPYFSFVSIRVPDQFVIYRNDANTGDWDQVVFLVSDSAVQNLPLKYHRLYKSKSKDSSAISIFHFFEVTPFVSDNKLYLWCYSPYLFNANKTEELLRKYKIPDFLQVDLLSGEVKEIHHVLDKLSISNNAANTSAFKPHNLYGGIFYDLNEKSFIIGNQVNGKLFRYDISNHVISDSSRVDILFDRHLEDTTHLLNTYIFNPDLLKVGSDQVFIRLIRVFSQNPKLRNRDYRNYLNNNCFFVLYDSKLQPFGIFKTNIYYNFLFTYDSNNYVIYKEGDQLIMKSFRLKETKRRVNLNDIFNHLENQIHQIDEVDNLDLTLFDSYIKENLPEYLLIVPTAGCYTCIRSVLEFIVKNTNVFNEIDIKMIYTSNYGIYPAVHDLIKAVDESHKIQVNYFDLENFIPPKTSEVFICKIKDNTVSEVLSFIDFAKQFGWISEED